MIGAASIPGCAGPGGCFFGFLKPPGPLQSNRCEAIGSRCNFKPLREEMTDGIQRQL